MSTGTDEATDVSRLPVRRVQQALLSWYRQNRRDLPWRHTRDPYRIWLSEVMLQQTQVDTALSYYDRFVDRFPTLQDLASAEVDEVLALWAGLGYYRRARNFHSAVREVAREYGGRVPRDATVFGSLPGVGPYTTGAVLSIAYDEPMPAIDGNVLRVMARLAGIADPIDRASGKRQVEEVATRLLDSTSPGDWNQAVMELGALICRPTSPKCDACPIETWCEAASDGTAAALPVSQGRTRVRRVDRLVVGVQTDGALIFVKRPGDGLLAGMWDLPALEGEPGTWPLPNDREVAIQRFLEESGFEGVALRELCGNAQHKFSHVEWSMWVYRAVAASVPPEGYHAVPLGSVATLPTATGIRKAIDLLVTEMP